MKPSFKLRSAETGTDYWIYIHGDEHSEGSPTPPTPAVLFMDGDDQFASAVEAYKAVRLLDAVRPLLLVGVGYGASYTKPANRRGRDYTPVAHSDEPTSGGANAFLKFLTTTLWPDLERRYRIENKARGIAGHSLGSLLVLYALFQTQPFFTHHLASAPSIWWADRDILRHVEKLRTQQATLTAELFLGVGENDTESMTQDLGSLEKRLAAQPFAQLRIASKRFPERDHYNVLPDAFGFGLNVLFGSKTSVATPDSAPAHARSNE